MLIHWTISIPCLLCFNVDVSIKDKTFVQSYYLSQKNLNFTPIFCSHVMNAQEETQLIAIDLTAYKPMDMNAELQL